MDDFDLLGDFPLGFEDLLDPQDLTDADFTVAELSAVDTGDSGGRRPLEHRP